MCACSGKGRASVFQRNTGRRSVSGRLVSGRVRQVTASTVRAMEVSKQRDYSLGQKRQDRNNINKLRQQAIQNSLGHS